MYYYYYYWWTVYILTYMKCGEEENTKKILFSYTQSPQIYI